MFSIKSSKLFVLLICLFFVLFPLRGFLKNLGCNYKFKSDSEDVVNVGQCRAGILTVYTWNKISGGKYYSKFIMGTYGEAIYLIKIGGEVIRTPSDDNGPDYILSGGFFVGNIKRVNDRKYIIDIDYPTDSMMIFPVYIKH